MWVTYEWEEKAWGDCFPEMAETAIKAWKEVRDVHVLHPQRGDNTAGGVEMLCLLTAGDGQVKASQLSQVKEPENKP